MGKERLHVLVAEDNPVNQILIHEVLKDAGMNCTLADDGTAALQALEEHEMGYYDVVLTDISMPKMDGLELARVVKTRFPGLPVIALSANADDVSIAQALAAGMDYFMTKPLELTNKSSMGILRFFASRQVHV